MQATAPQNDSLYEVGKYEQFTDSTNFKKANKLPEVKNLYFCRHCDAMPLLCQLSGKDDLSVSAWMDIDILIILKMTAVTKHQQFAE